MVIAKLTPALVRHKDDLTQDGLDPRPAARRHAGAGLRYGKQVATAPLRAWEAMGRLAVRGLQLVAALVIAGAYGHRLAAQQHGAGRAARGFAVAVAAVSVVAAVVLATIASLPLATAVVSRRCRSTYHLFVADLALALLWAVVFALFAAIFHHQSNGATALNKATVWLDLVNALLWLLSAAYGFTKTFLAGKVDALGGKLTAKLFGDMAEKPEKMKFGSNKKKQSCNEAPQVNRLAG